MNLIELRSALEKYHRRKWFPDSKSDPLEEWSDYANESTLHELIQLWKSSKQRHLLSIAYYIYSTLPSIRHRTLVRDLQQAYAEPLGSPEVTPLSVFYYLRQRPPETAREIWSSFRECLLRRETLLADWLQVTLEHEKRWSEFRDHYRQAFGLESTSDEMENQLRSSQELFHWELRQVSFAQTLPELLQNFRLEHWDNAADWNDFPALARTIIQQSSLRDTPDLRKSIQNDAIQFLFSIAPPERIILEYGAAAGPIDELRFLSEFAKGCFYRTIDPDLPFEDRITGDTSVPYFWGYLYSCAFSSKAGLSRFVNPSAEPLAKVFRLWLQFWYRYDLALAIYRMRVEKSSLTEAQQLYTSAMSSAFSMEVNDFLYLYDWDRSDHAFFRAYAMAMALSAEDRLRTRFGREWFVSEVCLRKFRDYWRAGYRLSLKEILIDLDVSAKFEYFWSFDS